MRHISKILSKEREFGAPYPTVKDRQMEVDNEINEAWRTASNKAHKNYQTRDKFFYASPSLFPNWEFKSRLAIGVNLKDFYGRNDSEYRFIVDGTTYIVDRARAFHYGNKYKMRYGVMPNIIPLAVFRCEAPEKPKKDYQPSLFAAILAIAIILNVGFVKPVQAKTYILIENIPQKQAPNAETKGDKKGLTSPSISSKYLARTAQGEQIKGLQKTVEPINKFLTQEGAKTREIVLAHLSKYYSGDDLIASDNILKKEAGYRYDAINEIGACGIVQALPCEKMGCGLTEGDVICQAQWFVGYINRRYGSPVKAWEHHQVNNWY